jgi:hypothetical protein
MWWQDLLWGFWNGLTAWLVLIVHIFGGWSQYPSTTLRGAGIGTTLASCSALARPSWALRAREAAGAANGGLNALVESAEQRRL